MGNNLSGFGVLGEPFSCFRENIDNLDQKVYNFKLVIDLAR